MKKIAIFVEGETECDFIIRLLKQFIGEENINIVANKMFGGNRNSGIQRSSKSYPSHSIADVNFQASIFISGNTENVTSDIREQGNSLILQGFSKIIGLRDIRGNKEGRQLLPSDLPNIERLHKLLENSYPSIPVKIITAVMEIETWFLAETNHYICIDNKLTKELILSKSDDLGFNPFTENLTLRLEPKEDLQNLYGLVKKTYSKKETVRNKTINCLDYSNLRSDVGSRIDQVKQLFDSIDEFIK
jgi:hypothetical protein